ncbi:ABC transporter substrate-binding protein [Methyloligella sp. 2.7D]|uniref:ABC transporter substrate-binding protein n=1 Tax=unclassified Methyloligella TaxID=2625955 RepID=UPI00157DC00C|nr:ABC transporter substrate-binding protein [Methyloligella sp. GL2]QKP78211.1 ABC transporter substrate-binding protein [Methyloligella sp. GL2]
MSHRVFCLAVCMFALMFGVAQAAETIPEKPETNEVSIGVQPWLGYGPWYIAKEKGFFAEHGLDDVKLVNFSEQKDINAALVSGELDVASLPTNAALQMAQTGLPLKIVLLLDFSLTADSIISKDVDSVKDFKGKKVAYELGATSDVLLNYALAANGMTIDDIEAVPMPAAQAGSALIAGQVPISVTYEPYLTVAMGQDDGVKLIYSAGENPGLISDVLAAPDTMLEEKPGVILALVESWNDALEYYRAHTDEGRAIIAKAVGATPEELETAFDGVQFYSVPENAEHLSKEFAGKTLKDVSEASYAAKILPEPFDPDGMVEVDFVEAANK